MLAILTSIGVALWKHGVSRGDKVMDRLHEKIEKGLACKVSVHDCNERHAFEDERHDRMQRFKERIGAESDEHRKRMTRIEKALIFLVQKNDGNPAELGLMKD